VLILDNKDAARAYELLRAKITKWEPAFIISNNYYLL
jgi:hypothetical protein